MSPQIFVCPVFSKDIFNSRYIIRRKFYVYAFGWIITYIACSVDCINRDKYNISSGKRIKLVVQGNCTITINEIKKFIICMTVCRVHGIMRFMHATFNTEPWNIVYHLLHMFIILLSNEYECCIRTAWIVKCKEMERSVYNIIFWVESYVQYIINTHIKYMQNNQKINKHLLIL